MIVFVHLPKSGGTSFREIMRSYFKTYEFWSNYSTQLSISDSANLSIPDSVKFVCGHNDADAFELLFPKAKIVTWMRHPVNRTISLYKHIISRKHMKNNPDAQYVIDRNLNFEEFVELKWTHNYSMNFIKKMNVESFFHIGFCEYFQESLDLFSKKLGLKKNLKSTWENKSQLGDFEIDKKILIKIVEYNSEEFEFYNRAKTIFIR